MPYLLFLYKRQNLKLSSAANYRWRFKGLLFICQCCLQIIFTNSLDPDRAPTKCQEQAATKCRAWSRSRLFDTLMVFLKGQARQNVEPDLNPNCLTLWWYSWKVRPDKMSSLIWIQTVWHSDGIPERSGQTKCRAWSWSRLFDTLILVFLKNHAPTKCWAWSGSRLFDTLMVILKDQAPTKCRAWSESRLFGTLMAFLKEFLKKSYDIKADDKKNTFPSKQWVNSFFFQTRKLPSPLCKRQISKICSLWNRILVI